MLKWSIEELKLPLKFVWKIARGSKAFTHIFIIRVRDESFCGEGEISFNIRYGETPEVIKESFEKFQRTFPSSIGSVEELINFLNDGEYPASFRFGVESAFVHYLALLVEKPVNELLGVPAINSVKTSFSIPIMEPGKVGEFIKQHNLSRFRSLKIKVGQDGGLDLVREVEKYYSGNLRIDANEAWTDPDEVIGFIEALGDSCPVEFLEQPMKASCHDEYLYLKDQAEVDIMADESILSGDVTDYHRDRFHAINIKLMKSGGYMKAIKQLRDAKELGLKTMIGCMVETSLGISSAMNIAHGVDYLDLDGSLLLEKDPFNLITEEKGKLFFSHLQ